MEFPYPAILLYFKIDEELEGASGSQFKVTTLTNLR